MMLQAAVLSVLLCSVCAFVLPASFDQMESSGNSIDHDKSSISARLEWANRNIRKNPNDSFQVYGDIAVPTGLQNADPCTRRGCLWPKATDGNVYVPYSISPQYSTRERNTILRGLRSFSQSTCIRFTPLNQQQDYVNIRSETGCFSFVGRRGRAQTVSLMRQGCVYTGTIQHELLHALGFDHEQTRSDRDLHVRILFENVQPGTEYNFRKINTINLNTSYDYNSVMHYDRFAFSRNRRPTIIPIPNSNVAIGRAKQMSPIDILRVNRLYRCNRTATGAPLPTNPQLEPKDIFLQRK